MSQFSTRSESGRWLNWWRVWNQKRGLLNTRKTGWCRPMLRRGYTPLAKHPLTYNNFMMTFWIQSASLDSTVCKRRLLMSLKLGESGPRLNNSITIHSSERSTKLMALTRWRSTTHLWKGPTSELQQTRSGARLTHARVQMRSWLKHLSLLTPLEMSESWRRKKLPKKLETPGEASSTSCMGLKVKKWWSSVPTTSEEMRTSTSLKKLSREEGSAELQSL